jgi:hypothetical protein
MIVLLLAEALRSRRGILRVGNVPHAKRIVGALARMVNSSAVLVAVQFEVFLEEWTKLLKQTVALPRPGPNELQTGTAFAIGLLRIGRRLRNEFYEVKV